MQALQAAVPSQSVVMLIISLGPAVLIRLEMLSSGHIQNRHGFNDVVQLLTIGADVLHRCGTDQTGNS